MIDDTTPGTGGSAYTSFFGRLTGHPPLPYQARLASGPWPELLRIPTGLGKTAAVVVAWLWKRLEDDPETPRRLVYCLPMRVLVEQTLALARSWVEAAAGAFSERRRTLPTIHPLMGGDVDREWLLQPEAPAILVGTQDMLLSRALLRGYGASPFSWPIHFAFLHNDALWVYDEVQLMGPGLATSSQLEAFRRIFGPARPSRSLWASATLEPAWLGTVDLRPHRFGFREERLGPDDNGEEIVRQRTAAAKSLAPARSRLDAASAKGKADGYLAALAEEVLEAHRPGATTLVILNQVERAQGLLRRLARRSAEIELLLVHSRFRPDERRSIERRLREDPGAAGRILVSTQVVEAGVDLTSEVLLTELCPWASFVQRAGRCNRYGETEAAEIRWIDLDPELPGAALPYQEADLATCRERLLGLRSAAPGDLAAPLGERPVSAVLRRPDLLDLFHTDPDLSGFYVDVSPYIRDADERTVQVFWRELETGRPDREEPAPEREELCTASIGAADRLVQRAGAWTFDRGMGRWTAVAKGSLRPGQVILVASTAGGYDPLLGFSPDSKTPVPTLSPAAGEPEPSTGSDEETYLGSWVPLEDHLRHVAAEVEGLCRAVGVGEDEGRALATAARWHDVGKAHAVFQEDLLRGLPHDDPRRGGLWAKAPRRTGGDGGGERDPRRRSFRHELASALAWLAHGAGSPGTDLVAYLIAAHHGKVRLSLRAYPGERPPEAGRRFARGVWDGDRLPSLRLGDGRQIPETPLDLEIMDLGEGSAGASWSTRTQALLAEHGPFRLAWLEALLRIADWRASATEARPAPVREEGSR